MELWTGLVAGLSLAVSATTLWLTYLRRGNLHMTTPTIVFFGYDVVPKITPKVFLRTLLYSSAARGQIVEGMYVKLRRDGVERTFSTWGYDESNKLVAGSGLFVPHTGVAANHHFVLSLHQQDDGFLAGRYELEVYARVVGRPRPIWLSTVELPLSVEHAEALVHHGGVVFEREPDGQGYRGYLRDRP